MAAPIAGGNQREWSAECWPRFQICNNPDKEPDLSNCEELKKFGEVRIEKMTKIQ